MADSDDEFPRLLTPAEVQFEVSFGLHLVPRSLLREYLGKDGIKADRARETIITTIAMRFDRYQVRAPAPATDGHPFWHVGNAK